MTNYIPKYQFEGITARRKAAGDNKYITIQRQLKNGNWGKPFTFEVKPTYELTEKGVRRNGWESDQKAFERFIEMNLNYNYRIANN